MKLITQLNEAQELLRQGRLIAYPTEAIYGLGCDPFNPTAVNSLLTLKGRVADKGLIVLIADWSQLPPLIASMTEEQLGRIGASWPGPVTWIFPKANSVPLWITGGLETIAIRMTAHPIAQALCATHPIISTSANISGHPPARSIEDVKRQFPQGIDALVQGALGGEKKPSQIYDVQTGLQIR
jgi:L-threonylcarbamoyladenylate synthase